MSIENTLDRVHFHVVRNALLQRFTVMTRILLAVGFIPPGLKKIFNSPFTMLPNTNPVGYFFEAFYGVTAWYEFVGWAQVIAALLLLFPRTATLGAIVYFPIILNITIITNSINFAGTWLITILMLLANVYLLCWDYDKLKIFFPRRNERKTEMSGKNLIFEPLIFGFLSLGFFAFLAIANIGNLQQRVLSGGVLMFVAGCLFGLFCVWHRRNLRVSE